MWGGYSETSYTSPYFILSLNTGWRKNDQERYFMYIERKTHFMYSI